MLENMQNMNQFPNLMMQGYAQFPQGFMDPNVNQNMMMMLNAQGGGQDPQNQQFHQNMMQNQFMQMNLQQNPLMGMQTVAQGYPGQPKVVSYKSNEKMGDGSTKQITYNLQIISLDPNNADVTRRINEVCSYFN